MHEQELIQRIKQKRELAGINEQVVKTQLENYLKKYKIDLQKVSEKESKIITKEIRAELRLLVGRFQVSLKDKTKLFELYSATSPLPLLKAHSSTAERLPVYPKIKELISSLKVKSVLDSFGTSPIGVG